MASWVNIGIYMEWLKNYQLGNKWKWEFLQLLYVFFLSLELLQNKVKKKKKDGELLVQNGKQVACCGKVDRAKCYQSPFLLHVDL